MPQIPTEVIPTEVMLDEGADPDFEGHEHPDALDTNEDEAGHAMYLAVDDLDDESNGLRVTA